jgi:hypothetical protein
MQSVYEAVRRHIESYHRRGEQAPSTLPIEPDLFQRLVDEQYGADPLVPVSSLQYVQVKNVEVFPAEGDHCVELVLEDELEDDEFDESGLEEYEAVEKWLRKEGVRIGVATMTATGFIACLAWIFDSPLGPVGLLAMIGGVLACAVHTGLMLWERHARGLSMPWEQRSAGDLFDEGR